MSDRQPPQGRKRPGLVARIRNLPVIGRPVRWLWLPPQDDEVHAPGHRHRGRPPEEPDPKAQQPEPRRNQPWVRTTHSDSQRRRFRR